MTLQCYSSPVLVDFLQVTHALRKDEVEQYEAFAGAFNPDEAAAVFFLRPGPKWCLTTDAGLTVAVAGFDLIREGVWQDWMFTRDEAWTGTNWRSTTRFVRRAMDGMLESGARRLQCVSLASRIDAHRWYSTLGLTLEGPLSCYGRQGQDALMFKRLADGCR